MISIDSSGAVSMPPIMGAAAFIMAETLGIPYNQLILVAIVPAALHYFAILWMVHLESKRLGLAGMDPKDIPTLRKVLASSWHLFIPLVAMVTLLLMQFTPFLAAFWGITLTIVCSWLPALMRRLPGVTQGGRPGRGSDLRMRGMGSGYTQILIDGERVPPGWYFDLAIGIESFGLILSE